MLSDIETDGTQDDINYPSAVPFLSVHLACFAAIWSGITWQSVVLCASLYWLRIFAVGAGYHRYFSHHAYSTSRAFQFVLAFLPRRARKKAGRLRIRVDLSPAIAQPSLLLVDASYRQEPE